MTTMDHTTFIETIGAAAVTDMVNAPAGLFVLASVTIAQAICESNWGTSAPGCNLFGVKANGSTRSANHVTQEFYNGTWISIVAGFRVYDSWLASIGDHSLFLYQNQRYHALLGNRDYVAVASVLHSAGYATDPRYADTLVNIIRNNGLTRFDTEAFDTMITLDAISTQLAAVNKRLDALEKINAITGPPAWFITEFGAHALDGIVTDLTGDAEFWRLAATALRITKK